MLNKNLIINFEDLNDKSIFINVPSTQISDYFNRILKIKSKNYYEFAKLINYDPSTVCDVKNNKIKASGYLFYNLLKLLDEKININNLSISSRNYKPIKIINNYINPELIGLIHSDGLMRMINTSVHFQFSNKDKELINRFCKLISSTFKCKISINKSKRDNTYYAHPPSVIARILAKKIGWKINEFKIPEFTKKELPSYIRGLFDGDGTIYLYKGKTIIPTIRITTQYKIHAKKIKELLEKIGIYSRICKEKRWFNVVITRKKDFLEFVNKIGSNHPKKKQKMVKIKKYLEN